jgi:hypothetical protein
MKKMYNENRKRLATYARNKTSIKCFMSLHTQRPVFTHRPQGPRPRAENFQGWHIKKIKIEVWCAEKKGCPRERNFREIYTENNVGTTARPSFVSFFVFFLLTYNTEYKQMGGGKIFLGPGA